jgi:hypothetical protein
VEELEEVEDNMAVQQINAKMIKKFNLDDPNFKPPPEPEPEEVNGNILETDMYGEQIQHFYQPDNGNLQITELMTGVLNKLDDLTTLNPNIVDTNRAIEVDIKREIAISKADINNVKSEEIKGKVNNKLSKLRKLRRK